MLRNLDPQILAAVGALASGGGSLAAAIYFVKQERKRAHKDCDERIEAFREGLRIIREEPRDASYRRPGTGG